ncbi:MAG: hypothetical protein RDU13_08495 [Elusimicrobiales bacterium]|jgi:O-antigen/teichoic acid export membrane protein|nr:hypothetical protein [Elusimicrobiales bacterium]
MNKSIALGILSGSLLTLTGIVVNILIIKLVIASLAPDIAGIWFIFLNIGAYILFLDLGISPTVAREIGFIIGRGNADESSREERISDFIRTVSSLFRFLTFFALIFALGGGIWLISSRGYGLEIIAGWIIFSFGAAINLLGGPAFAALFGLGQVSAEKLIKAFTQLLWLLMAWLALRAGTGILGLAAAWTVHSILGRLAGWWHLYRTNPWLRGKGHFDPAVLKTIAMPSLKWAAMGLGAILILQTDNIIIAYLMGPAVITRYEPVMKIVWVLMTFSLISINISVPFASRLHAAKDSAAFNALLMRNVRYGVGLVVILVPFIGVYGDRIVYIWLGDGYFPGNDVLWVLLAMLVLEVHHVVHASAVMAAGYIVFLPAALIAALLKIILSVLLCGQFGLIGVPLGTLLAQLFTNNWYAPYKSMEKFGYSLKSYFLKMVAPLLVCLVGNILLCRVSRSLLPIPDDLFSISGFFLFYFALVAGLFWAFIVPTEEKYRFRGLVKKYAAAVFA